MQSAARGGRAGAADGVAAFGSAGAQLSAAEEAVELARLRQRARELEEQLRLEKAKGEFLKAGLGGDDASSCLSGPSAAVASMRIPPRTFRVSSEVLVIVDEEQRVPTTLGDLLKQSKGRKDTRGADTPRHQRGVHRTRSLSNSVESDSADDDDGVGNPTAGLPMPQDAEGVPMDFPLDRIMTEATLTVMKDRAPNILTQDPIPPTATDAFNYITEAYDRERNTFHHDFKVYQTLIEKLCDEVSDIVAAEPLYREVESPCYVFGDIHGNFSDLSYFLDNIVNFRDLHFTPSNFLFLGDYVDRGPHGLECVMVLLALKLGYPKQVTMLRGNHEDPLVNGDMAHYGESSFMWQCRALFGQVRGGALWERINELVFRHLPLAADIDRRIFCAHGGIPRFSGGVDARMTVLRDPAFPRLASFSMFDNAPEEDRDWVRVATDLCWSDPLDREARPSGAPVPTDAYGFADNTRGPGTICFGKTAVDTFLEHTGFEYIFRAHQEKADGLRLSKSARVITIFSTSDYEGHRNGAGLLFVSHTGEIRMVIKKASAGAENDDDDEDDDDDEAQFVGCP